jgi:Flp pilus assembly protein TadD
MLHAEQGSNGPSLKEGLQLGNKDSLLQAERQLIQALQLEPANPDYHFELAGIYAARYDSLSQSAYSPGAAEMLERAGRELEQAVMLQPDFLAAHYNLGVIYKRQGRFEEAREQFRRVLGLHPNHAKAQIQLGATYEEQGFFEDAREEYLKAQEMDFLNPEIKFLVADLEERKKMARERALAEGFAASSMKSAGNQLDFSSPNRSSPYEGNPDDALQAQRAVKQALPYLASMLVQQWMSRRGSEDAEEA